MELIIPGLCKSDAFLVYDIQQWWNGCLTLLEENLLLLEPLESLLGFCLLENINEFKIKLHSYNRQ